MKPWKVIVLCLSILLGISFSIHQDRFQKVVDQQTNETIREKLISFKKGGIEKTVDTEEYDAEKAIAVAMNFLKTPHRMGGISKKGMDCSGLVMVAYRICGIKFPHSSQEQARYGKVIPSMHDLQRGDLVFFYDSYKTSNFITHSGIYLGEDNFIHTSNSKGVTINKVNDPYYWGPRFLFGTRLK